LGKRGIDRTKIFLLFNGIIALLICKVTAYRLKIVNAVILLANLDFFYVKSIIIGD
jgi:hypothetical protein